MVDKDELTWQHMTHKESQQAALVEYMKNSQEEAEYKVRCTHTIKMLKKLRKNVPNDQEFGAKATKLLNEL